MASVPALAADRAPAPAPAPADIRLEWLGSTEAIESEVGKTVEVRYVIRNTGGRPVFAVVLKTLTSLGPLGEPIRIQPGPEPGKRIERKLSFAVAAGIREICIEGALQNRNRDDALDPTPGDNRICRVVRVSQ